MKICHAIYIPRLSGAEILVRDLSIVHAKEGNEISILSIKPLQNSFKEILNLLDENGIKCYFPSHENGKLTRFNFVKQALTKIKPDVLIIHSIIPGLYIRLLQRLFQDCTPSILVLHDASQDDYKSFYFRIVELFLVKPPSYIVALSQKAINNYENRNKKKIKSKIIKNGVSIDTVLNGFKNREHTRKTVFNVVNESETVFLQVGRFSFEKQQHLSLEAFIEANNSLKGKGKLFFVGISEDQSYEKFVKNIVKNKGLSELVFFLGSRSDIPALLGGADIFLMPSNHEANSIAMIEALVSGIKIIANNIESFQEYKSEINLELIDCSDIILFSKSMINAITQKNMIRNKTRNLSTFSIENTAFEYSNLIKKLLN
jgi:L-malate glycosyltransferase